METAVVASCACPNNVFHRYMQGHQTVSARKSGIGDASLAPSSQTTIHQWLRRSWIHWCRFFNDCETSYCSGTPDALVLKQEQVVAMDGQEEIVLWRRGNGNCNGSWCWTSSNHVVLGWHNIFGYTHEGVMYVQTHVCICMYVMYVMCVCVCVHTQWYATCNMYKVYTYRWYMGPTYMLYVVCLIPSYFRIHTHDLLVCMCTH
mgnify:CR=1 FL=1